MTATALYDTCTCGRRKRFGRAHCSRCTAGRKAWRHRVQARKHARDALWPDLPAIVPRSSRAAQW